MEAHFLYMSDLSDVYRITYRAKLNYNIFTACKQSLCQGNIFTSMCQSFCPQVGSLYDVISAGARSKNSATNHSTFQKTSELFSIGGGHVVPVVNNTTCFSIYKWLLFLLLFSSYFPLLSHSFLK